YALKEAPPSEPNPSGSLSSPPKASGDKEPPGCGRVLIVFGLIAVCGTVLYFFGPKRGSYDSGVAEIRKHLDAIEQAKTAEREQTHQSLTRQLRNVKDEESARKALFECFLKGSEPAQVA